MKYLIVHYSEIALKKGNRAFFERALVDRIERLNLGRVSRLHGRILVELESEETDKLLSVFGVSDFLVSVKREQKIDEIAEAAIELISSKGGKSFKIETKRADKSFPMSSQELSAKIGSLVLEKIPDLKVSMNEADTICYIELVDGVAFISVDKVKGLGGLPLGTGGRAVSLLSGGIDSPVSSFLTMSRGVELVLVHFHTYPETSSSSIDKVIEIGKLLSRYQGETSLYLVPFAKAQKEIVLAVSPKNRVIFYRRVMLRIAEEVAKIEKCSAIVTGESLGQVASQTIENMGAIDAERNLLILRPLVSFDKERIIKIAREIGSYETSILPYDDSCSRFMPNHPETRADKEKILLEEKSLEVDRIVKETLGEVICKKIG